MKEELSMARPILDLEALLKVPYVDPYMGFDISPDSRHVAFSWNPTGRWEIYTLSLDGPAEPRQATTGEGGKFAPLWSPDGRYLAYVVDVDGGENFDIHCYDLVNGNHVNLTPDTPDAIQPNYCWSPDGEQIAFISNRSGRFETYVMLAAGGKARLALSLPHPGWEVHWSPDGRWLAIVVESHGQDWGVFVVPAAGGEARQISIKGEPICARDACWSPDGTQLAIASNAGGEVYNIAIYTLASGDIAWLTGGEGDKGSPAWSPGGEMLACTVQNGPQNVIVLLMPGGKAPVTFEVEQGVHSSPRFTPDGKYLAFGFESPRRPPDLWLADLLGEETETPARHTFRQLTQSLLPALREDPFKMPEHVSYPSFDGAQVPALRFLPDKTDELPPAVVYIHGGPTWHTQMVWNPVIQHMVSRGWVVLAPNYRGSTGYGMAWQLANRFDLGGIDTKDVTCSVDYLAAEGLADPRRIAATGASWGGYLTMTCLTQFPEQWAAGSAVVPFLNWFTGHKNSREDLQHWDIETFGTPEENYNLWHERSPYFFLDRIQAPVQMICGANDPRCPASESLAARDELEELGKHCDLALYDDEGHGFLKIENVLDSEVRRMVFLSGVLEGR
jgi:dipeptidyl aminopeptidase/acylaminoacyl peptidase